MATRTLIVSDLHIGFHDGCSVLEHRDVLELLLAAVGDCDRLVLLGDVIELKEADVSHAFAATRPILRELGARLGPDREVVFVPGNHDRLLVGKWVLAQGRSLRPDSVVPVDASPMLAELMAALAPARVQVRYPAVWLTERVWAHHGHYLDRHLLPRTTYGLIRKRVPAAAPGSWCPADYEPAYAARPRRLIRLLPQLALAGVESVEDLARARAAPAVPTNRLTRLHDWLLHPRLSPAISRILGAQMRLHSVPAVARVAHNLGEAPDWIVFGHVHRRGPMPGDDPREWRVADTPRLINTGSWRWERVLVHGAEPPHPYWPGGAVVIEGDGEPRSVGLLDGLSETELTRRR